jgi:hypothetical protein
VLEILKTLAVAVKSDTETPAQTATAKSSPTLRQELSELVKEVDVEDEAAVTSVRRDILRAILKRQFEGDGPGHAAELAEMVQVVDAAVASNSELSLALRGAIVALKSH